MGILGLMIIALFCVFVYRRGDPNLPHEPDTLWGVWSYLCAGSLPERFADMGLVDAKLRDASVIDAGETYSCWKEEKVGGRWVIDEDSQREETPYRDSTRSSFYEGQG